MLQGLFMSGGRVYGAQLELHSVASRLIGVPVVLQPNIRECVRFFERLDEFEFLLVRAGTDGELHFHAAADEFWGDIDDMNPGRKRRFEIHENLSPRKTAGIDLRIQEGGAVENFLRGWLLKIRGEFGLLLLERTDLSLPLRDVCTQLAIGVPAGVGGGAEAEQGEQADRAESTRPHKEGPLILERRSG